MVFVRRAWNYLFAYWHLGTDDVPYFGFYNPTLKVLVFIFATLSVQSIQW
jgi:hypothetical protein